MSQLIALWAERLPDLDDLALQQGAVLDDDQLRAMRGVVNGILLSVPVWVALGALARRLLR